MSRIINCNARELAGELDRFDRGYVKIVADPPWAYNNRYGYRKDNPEKLCRFGLGAAGRYASAEGEESVMTIDELAAMPIDQIVADDALLALWITGPHLALGSHLAVMAGWGFEPITIGFVWVKVYCALWAKLGAAVDNYMAHRAMPMFDGAGWLLSFISKATVASFSGVGHYIPSNAEIVLIGRRGQAISRATDEAGGEIVERQVIFSVADEHSAKPDEMQRRFNHMYPQGPAIELFARRPVGPELAAEIGEWDTFGNELPT